jgi:hypothetical protein
MSRATAPGCGKVRTRGKAEEIGTRLMAVGACTIGLGLLLCLTIVLAWLGVSFIVVGIVIILGDIAWLSRMMKLPTEEVCCPNCQTRNLALCEGARFQCDECGHTLERPGNSVPIKPGVPA